MCLLDEVQLAVAPVISHTVGVSSVEASSARENADLSRTWSCLCFGVVWATGHRGKEGELGEQSE